MRPELVDVSTNGNHIQFTVMYLGVQEMTFQGEVTKDGLHGTFDEIEIWLPRKKSFWH